MEYDQLSHPPKSALKQIGGGRLKGMTDINPQWRIQVMTETFGPAGEGWKYRIVRFWERACEDANDQVAVFAQIELRVKRSGKWSDPIPGVGGSMLVAQEKNGLFVNDEAYKMALTDALSVAMKQLGVGAAIYSGQWDGTKYRDRDPASASASGPAKAEQPVPDPRRGAEEIAKSLAHLREGASAPGGPEKPAPAAEKPALPPYPDEKIEANLAAWRQAVREQKHTAGTICATIMSRYSLTDEQVDMIENEVMK